MEPHPWGDMSCVVMCWEVGTLPCQEGVQAPSSLGCNHSASLRLGNQDGVAWCRQACCMAARLAALGQICSVGNPDRHYLVRLSLGWSPMWTEGGGSRGPWIGERMAGLQHCWGSASLLGALETLSCMSGCCTGPEHSAVHSSLHSWDLTHCAEICWHLCDNLGPASPSHGS